MKRNAQQALDILPKIFRASDKTVDFLLLCPHPQCEIDKPLSPAILEPALRDSDLRKAVQNVADQAKDGEDLELFKAVAEDHIRNRYKEFAKDLSAVELFNTVFDDIVKHTDKNK